MRIERDLNKMSRGVTQLSYVGDADKATDSTRKRDLTMIAVGGAVALWGRGVLQLAGVVAAGYGIKRIVKP